MPGQLIDKMHRNAVTRVRPGIYIGHIHLMSSRIVQHFFVQAVKGFLATGLVIVPAQLPMGKLIVHKKLVLGRTTCMLACDSTQSTIGSQHTFMIIQSLLHQLLSGQIKYRQL